MNLKAKSDIINDLLFDLNAEFLVSCLLDEGFGQNKILAVFDGQLRRPWSRDINYTEIEQYENGSEALNIHLNRDGIYDALPEALFHDMQEENSNTGKEMAEESMKLKMEEKEARLFFKPFENEIFFQKAHLAQNETEIYESLFADLLNGLIPDFWKIDNKIPSKYTSKLIKLLPFVHKITGNYRLTAEALEFILNEKVEIRIESEEPKDFLTDNKQDSGILGTGVLGKDLIMGNRISGFIGRLFVNIGPLYNSQPKDYFTNESLQRLLNCFFGYFIPMELDVKTNLIMLEEKSKFVLGEEKEGVGSYLGFNSVL